MNVQGDNNETRFLLANNPCRVRCAPRFVSPPPRPIPRPPPRPSPNLYLILHPAQCSR